MALRDFFGGVASVCLLFAKIILCLMFTIYDSLEEKRGRRRRPAEAAESLPALERG